MRGLEAFRGVQVLTVAPMSKHSHLLGQAPERKALCELELLERIGAGYGSTSPGHGTGGGAPA
jgi:hypothetical protein